MPESVDPQLLRLTNDSATGETLVEGVLLGAECRDCGVKVFGPARFCQSCTSSNLAEVQLGAEGTLFSYTIVRVPPAGWPGPVPYILGEIELMEGPHVLAEVIDAKESDLAIGMIMELAFQMVTANSQAPDKLPHKLPHELPHELVVYKWRPVSPIKQPQSNTGNYQGETSQ